MLITPLFFFACTSIGATHGAAISCRPVTFSVSVSAQNENYADDFDPTNTTSLNNFVSQALETGTVNINGTVLTSGTFSISAQYCAPSDTKPPTSIQVLVHGNTYNRKIWDGLGLESLQNEGYSWQRLAAAEGLATLALDMIGHGQSTIPDPNTVVQMPLEAAIINNISRSLKSTRNPLGNAFKKVIFIGHSYGSITGIAAARLYLNFADAMVLTGWSSSPVVPSPLIPLQFLSASLVSSRFAGYPLGYLTASNETARTAMFYGGNFDPIIPNLDFELEDVVTTGEDGSFVAGFQPASQFSGQVFAVTGDQDGIFCGSINGACDDQLTNSKAFVPNAAVFDTYVIPHTGHDFMLHRSSQSTFALIQDWLKENL
jgi:pimeloyl-ACP methyl ester carboxylesterase